MAFRIRDASVLAYAQGFTLWHYKSSDDDCATVRRPGYFDDPLSADVLSTGDWIMVNARDGSQMLALGKPREGTARIAVPLTPDPQPTNGGA